MKKLLLLFFTFLISSSSFSQSDNTAYLAQRKKINKLLTARNARFNQYDESLTMHTGIFGWKTKKDMQRSIDILTDVFRTDNNILKETKILLDYKDFEKTQVLTKVVENEDRVNSYMSTITKLQNQNDKLNKQIKDLEVQKDKSNWPVVGLSVVSLILLVLLFNRKKPKTA